MNAEQFAREWISAWNAHDLDAIMAHYDAEVVLVSPAAAMVLDRPSGRVEGAVALRAYFQRGLELYPDFHFELLDVMHGLASIVLCFKNQRGTRTAEYMELASNGKITRVAAHYSS